MGDSCLFLTWFDIERIKSFAVVALQHNRNRNAVFSGFLKCKLEQMSCLEHPWKEKKKGVLRDSEQLYPPSKFSPPRTGELNPAPSGCEATVLTTVITRVRK